jgi:hypothetical protein
MKKLFTISLYALVAFALVVGSVSLPGKAADHLDAPGMTSPGGDGSLDINDVYAFQSPMNPANTVLVMTVNPAAGAISGTTFSSGTRYEFLIDRNGDAQEDARIRITFGRPQRDGRQKVKVEGPRFEAEGYTGTNLKVKGGGWAHAGLFDDPFFFDLAAFQQLVTGPRAFCDAGTTDFFAGLNTSAIVIEVPSHKLGPNNIGVWARTTRSGQQIDRKGRPAINTVFIPNNPLEPTGSEPSQKNAFNAGKPADDQANFRAEVVDSLLALGNDQATADALADVLLPDILTIDTSSSAGFLNGRGLADDVIDAELGLITGGPVSSDCVDANDVPFLANFPYLAPAN